MCSITGAMSLLPTVLSVGVGMATSAAQSKARIAEQNRQYAANKAAAQAAYQTSADTAALRYKQNNKKIRQDAFDFELKGKLAESQLVTMAGASNLAGGSIAETLADARGRWTKDARRFIDDKRNLKDSYIQDLENLRVSMDNQINTVAQGRWTTGDTLSMLSPLAGGFSSLMIDRQNSALNNWRMGNVGRLPGELSGVRRDFGLGSYTGAGFSE